METWRRCHRQEQRHVVRTPAGMSLVDSHLGRPGRRVYVDVLRPRITLTIHLNKRGIDAFACRNESAAAQMSNDAESDSVKSLSVKVLASLA